MLIEQNGLPDKPGNWLTLSGHMNWAEKLTISQDESKEGQLKMWADLRCWLIKKKDRDIFLKCIEASKFHGTGWCYPELHDHWIGEYPWASSCHNIKEWFEGDSWLRDCPIEIMQTVCGIHNEGAGFYPRLPSPTLFRLLNLSWAGKDYDYIDLNGDTLAFSQNYGGEGSHLFVKREEFLRCIDSAGYVPFWAIISERSCYSHKASRSVVKKWAITQRVYGYEDSQFKCHQDKEYEIPLHN